MGADSFVLAERAAGWLGLEIPEQGRIKLVRYADWLVREAIGAGGFGPNEENRVWSRHIADSILFGVDLVSGESCLDVGSGAGLPGIPLAILRPDITFDLVDRSGRRCDLLRRATAVLGLENCGVIHRDIAVVDKKYDRIVSRASLPPARLMIHVKRLLRRGGSATVGLSRTGTDLGLLSVPPGLERSTVDVPADILDTAVHLLRIVAA
jgi:16S rRNA (guanine527-N7)-methyltransferase